MRKREVEGETPDYCYDTNDWEMTYEWPSREDLTDGYDVHQVVEVACLKELPHKYAVTLVVDYTCEGDPNEWETFWYDTEEEAEQAVTDNNYDFWLAERIEQ